MRYTLWSHGILVGRTDLDIPTVTPTMRQGFIEPTNEGSAALRDATCVNRVINENRHRRRLRGGDGEMTMEDIEVFQAACDRREAVQFELRDENGQPFECEFMRVWDLHEMNSDQWREDEEWETELHLATMTPEERAEFDAELDETDEEMREDRAEEEMYHSSWPPGPEPDERWATMQYHLQVHLKGCFDSAEEDAVDLM